MFALFHIMNIKFVVRFCDFSFQLKRKVSLSWDENLHCCSNNEGNKTKMKGSS